MGAEAGDGHPSPWGLRWQHAHQAEDGALSQILRFRELAPITPMPLQIYFLQGFLIPERGPHHIGTHWRNLLGQKVHRSPTVNGADPGAMVGVTEVPPQRVEGDRSTNPRTAFPANDWGCASKPWGPRMFLEGGWGLCAHCADGPDQTPRRQQSINKS